MPRVLAKLEKKIKEFRRSRDEVNKKISQMSERELKKYKAQNPRQRKTKEKALAWHEKQKQYRITPRRVSKATPVEMGKFSMKTRSKNRIAFAKALAKAKKD